ncbi:MAG: Lrp/AsnC family transcriptional regulator [Dokdonella sp.]
MELDRFDRQLLNLVQQDAGQTAERLAEQVSLSPSAIQRRLRRLREEGVILREIAVVDPRKIGRPVHFVVSVQVEHERPGMMGQLRQWLAGTCPAGLLRDRRSRFHPRRDGPGYRNVRRADVAHARGKCEREALHDSCGDDRGQARPRYSGTARERGMTSSG